MRVAIAGLILAALLIPAVAPARNATPSQIIKRFNKERKRNGFPARVKLDKTWTRRCKKHNSWMRRNHALQHVETPGSPGYSKEGNMGGQNSVLSQDTTWKKGNPWLNAPVHLNQMLSPRLVKAGAHESKNRNCFSTFVGYDYTSYPNRKDKIYHYPRVAAYAQTAYEYPHSPQHFVGIKDGRTTGPYIYVFWDGPEGGELNPLSVLKSARMTGPGGKVKIKVLNSRIKGEGYFLAPNSGFVLPVKPLRKGRKYKVGVTFTTARGVRPKRSFKSRFTFRTSGSKLKDLGPAWTGHYND